MDVSNRVSPKNCKLTYDILTNVLKYMELKDIITKFMQLSKGVNQFVREENYLLYKKFL